MKSSVIRLLLVCALFVVVTHSQEDPTVSTTLGTMFGRVQSFEDKFVYQFLGIRYAVAPIGTLRFKKPIPRSSWTGNLDASRYGPSCAQSANTQWLPNRAMTEDCLLLNIYVPNTLTQSTRKSVMVWIHGGGFVAGQGMGNDGSNLALMGDVIVVTINYRLDVFGFLSTMDGNSMGNYGLWDQLEALRFVKANIAAFGGNPNSITIFGESGGGYSVGLLALSPLSRGLFQRAICESGVAIGPRSIAFDPRNFTRRFSDNLGCTRDNPDRSWNTTFFMECLRSKNTNEILQASGQARRPQELVWRLQIAPTIDGEILPRRPEYLISSANTQFYNPMTDIDFMAGVNNREGSLIVWPLRTHQRQLRFSLNQGIPTNVLCNAIIPSLTTDYLNASREISRGICSLYSTNEGNAQQGLNATNMYGDMMFVAPTYLAALVHSRHNNGRRTYMYLFSQQASPTTSPWWMSGAAHGAEINYVFGRRVVNSALSLQMMKYWTNFAKHGNPNELSESNQGQWLQFNATLKAYMSLGPTIRPANDLWPRRMLFWTSTVPRILNRYPRRSETFPTTPSTQGQGQNSESSGAQTSGVVRYLGTPLSIFISVVISVAILA